MAYANPKDETLAEAENVATLIETLRGMGIECPDLLEFSIDSETNFREVIEARLKAVGEVEAMISGLKEYTDTLDERKKRFEKARDRLREEIGEALSLSKQDRFVTAYGTLSLKRSPPRMTITTESQIPEEFFEMKVNTTELKSALVAWNKGLEERKAIRDEAEREEALTKYYREYPPIAGAELIEGKMTFAIKRK